MSTNYCPGCNHPVLLRTSAGTCGAAECEAFAAAVREGRPVPGVVMGIDPGYVRSAWVVVDAVTRRPSLFGLDENGVLLQRLRSGAMGPRTRAVIEQVEGMGMAVGKEVFETVHWGGRFHQALDHRGIPVERVTRRAVKLHLCGTSRAKDPNVRQALIDRYGPEKSEAIGTKGHPGPLYGIGADVWAALAVAVTSLEQANAAVDGRAA